MAIQLQGDFHRDILPSPCACTNLVEVGQTVETKDKGIISWECYCQGENFFLTELNKVTDFHLVRWLNVISMSFALINEALTIVISVSKPRLLPQLWMMSKGLFVLQIVKMVNIECLL